MCASEARRVAKSDTREVFIQKAKAIHGDRYDYSKVVYSGQSHGVTIVCPEHGEFTKSAGNHIQRKQGCPLCGYAGGAKKNTLTSSEYINRVKLVDHHGDYDLSKIVYNGMNERIVVTCVKHNTVCHPRAIDFLLGRDPCEECSRGKHIRSVEKRAISWQQFMNDASATHNGKYEYKTPETFSLTDTITIVCPEHGEFEQTGYDHRAGKGCKACGVTRAADTKRRTYDEFVQMARNTHGDKYDYSEVDYRNNGYKIKIGCPTHGWFWQRPYNHLLGFGCGGCSVGTSKAELEILEYIGDLGEETLSRQKIGGYEYDIIIENKRVAIEYCGNYWHSELNGKGWKYHLNKLNIAHENGYRLLTIFEDEWVNKEEIVKSRIRNILGHSIRGVAARKLSITEIDFPTARDFINSHHIQGSNKQMGVRFGAYDGETLVAVMTFHKSRKSLGGDGTQWELVRFTTDGKSYAGVASRLLSHFVRKYGGDVISYADRRWSEGKLYEALGFENVGASPPSFWYMKCNNYLRRYHRFAYRKARAVELFSADASKTAWAIMQENGYDRIWDCGSIKFVLSTGNG